MKVLLKNLLYQSRSFAFVILLCALGFLNAQTGNYISNGSFEEYYHCNGNSALGKVKSWLSIDSSSFGGFYISTCNQQIPYNGSGFQYPHSGNSYIGTTMYCLPCGRSYLKNRLKANLKAGTTYCVRFYINITDVSPRGIDGFAIYFGDNTIDTIKYCQVPLTYLTPQVKNPLGNVISDTMNWTAISGTFVANGTEKYAVIGNFLADNAVTTASINTPYYPQYWTDVYVDDVSCIEVNLTAYAGPDKIIVTGDSAFIGRVPDFALDGGCVWYQFPNMATPIATISGLWVKPTTASTYIVKQTLDCSSEKWDTVVIMMNPVGLQKLRLLSEELKIYPVPASDFIELKFSNSELLKGFKNILIYNNIGVLLREEALRQAQQPDDEFKIKTDNLPEGVYFLELNSVRGGTVRKRFVIAR